jgi:hypothetical protein
MIVLATCKAQCWDSNRCITYQPGDTVEIDLDSPHGAALASITIGYPKPGEQPEYIFDFPRISAVAARAIAIDSKKAG